MPETPLLVVAGSLKDADGRLLLTRRPPGKVRAGLWEFPGGKVQAGESPEEALRREFQEELGLHVEVGRELLRITHSYPDLTIELILFEIRTHGDPQCLENQKLGWFSPEEIADLDLCPADRKLWRLLSPSCSC